MSDDAASDDALLRLVESMNRNRGRWKRRVCLILSREKFYLTDIDFINNVYSYSTSLASVLISYLSLCILIQGVVQTYMYDISDITMFCIHPVEEVFGFLLSNKISGANLNFLLIRVTEIYTEYCITHVQTC